MTGWEVWRLPAALRLYVCGVVAAAAAVAGWTAALTAWRAQDVVLFGLLTGFGAVVVELGRWAGPLEPAGMSKDVYAAWLLPTAFLLPPVYGLAASVLTVTLLQVRARRTIFHRRVFSAAANGLTLAAVSAGFHAVPVSTGRPLWWLLAAVGCAVAWLVVTTVLTGTAVWLTDRTVSVRDVLLTPAPLVTDVAELAVGVLIAGAIVGFGQVMLVPALPLVAVLYRLFRASQWDTRVDPDTGLLQAAFWRAEAEAQLARASRTSSPLVVGIVHVDLAGNPRGYLAHNAALTAAAATVRANLRPYDLTGRMGQQVVFALPDTTADEARQIATRLRDALAAQLDAAEPSQEPECIAVTLGLAATDAPGLTDLTGLLATADAALTQARQDGQHHVCLDTSPTTPGDLGPSATDEDYQEAITAARRALGPLLAERRKAAGLTQKELHYLIVHWARSTIADAESPECNNSYKAEFWAACDEATDADGDVIAAHARVEALKAKAAARRRAAEQDQRRRAAAADTPAGAFALVAAACPHCGGSLAGVKVTASINGVLPQHTHTHLPE